MIRIDRKNRIRQSAVHLGAPPQGETLRPTNVKSEKQVWNREYIGYTRMCADPSTLWPWFSEA